MIRKIVAGIMVAIVLVVGWIAYQKLSQSKSLIDAIQHIGKTEESRPYVVSSSTEFYTIEVDLKPTGHRSSDLLVQQDVQSMVKRFEKDYSPNNFKDTDKELLFPGGNLWSGSWKGIVTSQAGEFVNYRVNAYEYTGGAHGNPSLRTYVFDANGYEIDLDQVFAVGSNYEERLSELSRQYLLAGKVIEPELANSIKADPSILQSEYVYSGTEPSANNFDNFALEHPGLRISFNAYQVAAYALGQPEIMISWSDIKDIVNPEILERVHSGWSKDSE